jgi:hypothetical protein
MDSNHNSSLASFNQDLVSETSTMSDGENSIVTAVEGNDLDYISNHMDEHRLNNKD